MKNMWLLIPACLAFFFCATPINERLLAAPGDAIVTPGELVVEHPTLINLGFEWHIDGDANRNATRRRVVPQAGRDAPGRKAMPLVRLQGERIYQRERVQPGLAEHVRRQHPRSRARHRVRSALRDDGSRRRQRTGGERDEDGHRAHASRAEAGRGRQGLSRVSRRSGRGRRPSRRSKGSCAPTTTTAAPATPRRADGRA